VPPLLGLLSHPSAQSSRSRTDFSKVNSFRQTAARKSILSSLPSGIFVVDPRFVCRPYRPFAFLVSDLLCSNSPDDSFDRESVRVRHFPSSLKVGGVVILLIQHEMAVVPGRIFAGPPRWKPDFFFFDSLPFLLSRSYLQDFVKSRLLFGYSCLFFFFFLESILSRIPSPGGTLSASLGTTA